MFLFFSLNAAGLIILTSTDTAPLSGTYPEACLRKYWAFPVKIDIMHEVGLRILVRKIQLVGAQYDKAFAPIFSFSKEHYMRVYLRCEKRKERADEILQQHGM